ncbi:hypothetical protein PIIN_08973 [Serendipita indica DSM 11827]|uniref:Uncharacterized protein n=1 Tax=Serendipita indica (strain DSM 11827) TaxID=1109443 RepID=G4U2B6_SERID|nr:hypothetical protein PIIN_08973 [Serendipita indica DSM 11827]
MASHIFNSSHESESDNRMATAELRDCLSIRFTVRRRIDNLWWRHCTLSSPIVGMNLHEGQTPFPAAHVERGSNWSLPREVIHHHRQCALWTTAHTKCSTRGMKDSQSADHSIWAHLRPLMESYIADECPQLDPKNGSYFMARSPLRLWPPKRSEQRSDGCSIRKTSSWELSSIKGHDGM